ncbi:hypothetical protein Q7C36_008061 [Tachysurus vachellii]|uniref:Uncharacterized protein n=1 Tax=Tachysurus vachellii TaxID=175792 RepID=A0AA88NFT2_TACVA|nr:hypothetical protein Q7C36_008061 [Tachysurus vachellii]
MQRLRVKERCLFHAMTKSPSDAERAGTTTGKRHSKVTKMIRDIPRHSNKGAQTVELTDERKLTDRRSWWKDTIKVGDSLRHRYIHKAYSFTVWTQEALRHQASYFFKNFPRPILWDKIHYKILSMFLSLDFLKKTPGPGSYESMSNVFQLCTHTCHQK